MDLTLVLKQFAYLATPIGLMVCLSIGAIFLKILGKHKFTQVFMITALAITWLSSTPWFSLLIAEKILSDSVIEIPIDELPKADAIVVYSWTKSFKKNDMQMRRFGSYNSYQAALIYAQQKVPIIVTSSEYPPHNSPAADEITFARARLNMLNVPNEDIYISSQGRNTRESVISIKKYLDEIKAQKLILIASDQRMPRKYFSLKKALNNPHMQIFPYSNPKAEQAHPSPSYKLEHWLPNVNALKLTTHSLHELLGLVAYRLIGWI